MRTLLTLAVLIAALGPVAHAQDETIPSVGPTLGGGPDVALPVEAAAPAAEAPPLMMPQALPHYYGRGEWPGFGGCGNGCGQGCGAGHACGANCGSPACDGTAWGVCPRPRTYNLHLWDNYCHESTRCQACGFTLGSLAHYWCCERNNQCGCASCGCGRGGCGCADRGGPAAGPATSEPRRGDEPAAVPVPPPPSEKTIDKSVQKKPEGTKPGAKKDLPKDMGTPTPMDPVPPPPMPKDMKEKTETKKSNRVVPAPRSASLLDRLFHWATPGSR